MNITLTKTCWQGNQWAAIDIMPIDERLFMPLLTHLMTIYQFPLPPILDKITGYATDFSILCAQATLDIDIYDFSLAFSDDTVRDAVFEHLQCVPWYDEID